MNYFKRIFPFIFLLFLAFFSCKDDTFDDMNFDDPSSPSYKIIGNCPTPDDLYVSSYDIDDTVLPPDYVIEYTWPFVTDADGYEFRIFVDDVPVVLLPYNPAASQDLTIDTIGSDSNSYTVSLGGLALGAVLKAQVRTICDINDPTGHSDWLDNVRGHGNGGATVDDIGFSIEAWNLVYDSECEYVRFKEGLINGCDNQPIDLKLPNDAEITFFKKEQVCNIILTNNEVCVGLTEVATQIINGSIMGHLKRDFIICDPNQPARTGCNGVAGEYDNIACAYPLNDYNWHSADDSGVTFNNIGATADAVSSSCLSSPKSAKRNVWFMFGAPDSQNIEIELQPVGNFRNYYMALFEWNDDGDQQVQGAELIELSNDVDIGGTWSSGCQFVSTNIRTSIAATNLDPTKTYFLSVDNISSFKGSFNLKVSDEVGFDHAQGAFNLTAFPYSDACYTEDGKGNLFTTANKTIDMDGAISCAPGGRNRNIWFQFEDPGTGEIEIEVSSTTNIRYYYMTLWKWNDTDNDGFLEAAELTEMPEGLDVANGVWSSGCRYISSSSVSSTSVAAKNLELGEKYFLSIEKHGASNVNLELCVYDNISMDYAHGAYNLTDVTPPNNSWCSAVNGFSTIYATQDMNAGSCDINTSTTRNVWFRIDLPNTSNIELDIDPYGTFKYYDMTLWEWDDNNGDGVIDVNTSELSEISCNYVYNTGLGNLSVDNLASGTYLFSVDNMSNYKGEFELCFDRQDSN